MRRRVAGAFDRFVDVRDMSDGEIARTLRDMQSDIVVDLACHTAHSRPGIMARRPAPIQVNYLGYPGTTGSPYHDYIIADATIITPEEHRFYSEAVVTMPDTYWINDSRRHKARRSTTRAEEGLPESGFVFCCFNNNYKITPQIFDIWMRLLSKVEGSVLWLLGDSAAAISNLKRHAEKRGIAPNRLIFAPRLGFDAHLDRHLHADLFLDTQFYNGHTTTADALWAGGPVVTCPGETFASRVAASLVRAANLPELVADSFDDYEALALALARDPARLAATRRKLIANRDICPLFDTKRFTRHLEAAYTVMITQLRNGEKPEAFTVVRYA